MKITLDHEGKWLGWVFLDPIEGLMKRLSYQDHLPCYLSFLSLIYSVSMAVFVIARWKDWQSWMIDRWVFLTYLWELFRARFNRS